MMSEAVEQHRWLQQLLGEWEYEHACDPEPGQPVETVRGRERVSAVGALWIVGEGEAVMPGHGPMHTRITLGYDLRKQRYVGHWVGSMMDYQWIYEGQLDADGRVLTLDCVGPSFKGDGGMAQYQDIITVIDDHTRTLTSRVLQEDGTWQQFMLATYRRVG